MALLRKQIAINGRKLSYLEAGHGKPVVLIHAFRLNAEMWEPQLASRGAEDGLTPVAEAKRIHELVPGAWLVVIPGAAHLSNMERPDQFNAALRRFARGFE